MDKNIFEGNTVRSRRIIHTPSSFAKSSLIWLQETGSLQAKKQYTSKREDLISYLVFIVVSGSGTLSYDSRKFTLNPGAVVFIDCRRPYSHTTSKSFWRLSWVHFNGSTMPNIYSKYLERGGTPVLYPKDTEAYVKCLDNIYTLADKSDYLKDMKLNIELNILLAKLLEDAWNPSHGKKNLSSGRNLSDVRLYLEDTFTEKFSLDKLAEKFYINKYYLSRLFKEQFGVSIGVFVTEKRITHAKYLLRFSEDTMEEIANACGFEDPNYFSRTFKNVEGISPSRFRKLWDS
ncbi:MAG: helix-turn-helix transcriptional regulator [Lachnospiraceae bacterium]|nr:helix-turn-helix transcriptional regulator [Lachnospiraceae bacterium]